MIRVLCNKDNFKMYAMDVDKKEYPDLIYNQYNNIVIQGDLFDLQYGTEYTITTEKEPSNYGYRVRNITYKMPTTPQQKFLFLCEVLTPLQAETIMKHYPDIIERVKENRLDDVDLNKLKGIKEKTFKKIVDKIVKNYCLCDLVIEFKGYISLAYIKKIYDSYTSVDKVREALRKDAYKCLCDLNGVGFKIADKMLLEIEKASKENIAKGEPPIIDFSEDLISSSQRCKACVEYLLKQNEDSGHTKMNIAELRRKCIDEVKECSDKFTDVLKDEKFYYNLEHMEVSLRSTYAKEYSVCKTLVNALKNNNQVWDIDIEKYRTVNGCECTDEQLSILDKIRQHSIAVLNGVGGSGKSFTLQTVLLMLKELKKSYLLLAPTGKASKVIAEYTNENTMTIHRGLGYTQGIGFTFNKNNRLPQDVIIVDEFSMVDISLMKHLVDAIDFTKTKLLIVGDNSQLSSVGCGNILHDLMQTKLIPTTTLTKVFRYSDGGLMKVATDVRLSEQYLTKDMKNKITTFGKSKDYTFIDIPDDKIIKNVVALYKKLLSLGNTINDIQVITAQNIGEYGTIALNNKIQKVVNKNYGSENTISYTYNKTQINYYVGDLVIQTKNNYSATIVDENYNTISIRDPRNPSKEVNETAFVANGESGIIKEIISNYMIIDFDGILIRYTKSDLPNINLGYVITVHKSQGSSCKNIILCTPSAHSFMLNSNLIYVGLTRMKEKCFHFSNIKTINYAIKIKENLNRNTYMQRLLTDMYNGIEVEIPYKTPKVA